jgi:hypothetical protein
MYTCKYCPYQASKEGKMATHLRVNHKTPPTASEAAVALPFLAVQAAGGVCARVESADSGPSGPDPRSAVITGERCSNFIDDATFADAESIVKLIFGSGKPVVCDDVSTASAAGAGVAAADTSAGANATTNITIDTDADANEGVMQRLLTALRETPPQELAHRVGQARFLLEGMDAAGCDSAERRTVLNSLALQPE